MQEEAMIFSIKTLSKGLVDHPFVTRTYQDGQQEIELKSLEDLMKLSRDLGERLIVSAQCYDNPQLPLIEVYDDYLE